MLKSLSFQSYSFAPTCSSATPIEEVEIPNPVPVEVPIEVPVNQLEKEDTTKNMKKEEIGEKTAKSDNIEEVPNTQNETMGQTGICQDIFQDSLSIP